jgi:ankyrin repeat protein
MLRLAAGQLLGSLSDQSTAKKSAAKNKKTPKRQRSANTVTDVQAELWQAVENENVDATNLDTTLDAIRRAIAGGANVNARNGKHRTPLDVVNKFCVTGPNSPEYKKIANLLRENGAMTTGELLAQRAQQAQRALLEAIQNEDLEAVREAINRGADPNIRDDQGQTPLDIAMNTAKPQEIINLLRY